jgi:hypothetical protein
VKVSEALLCLSEDQFGTMQSKGDCIAGANSLIPRQH